MRLMQKKEDKKKLLQERDRKLAQYKAIQESIEAEDSKHV